MKPARFYTAGAGLFLLVQGVSTLAFRLVPALDRAFPPLLELTRMQPPHSLLHIATGGLALAALRWGGARGCWYFALLFGAFYAGLAIFGFATHHATPLGLQAFDHPFHLVLGLAGLVCAALSYLPTFSRRALS